MTERREMTDEEALAEFTTYDIAFAAVFTLRFVTGNMLWPSEVNQTSGVNWRTKSGYSELMVDVHGGRMTWRYTYERDGLTYTVFHDQANKSIPESVEVARELRSINRSVLAMYPPGKRPRK